jgi:hypothetical protein
VRFVGARWLAGLLAALTGCLVDSDAPCGDELQPASGGACVCPEGLRLLAGQCVAVEEAATTTAASCAPGEGCECESSSNCPTGELCDAFGSGRCAPAPAGLGSACGSAADCASGEATYCETFSTRTCQVQGCKERSGACPGDFLCCDFAILGTSLCIPPATAPDGQCPAPGALVTRSGSP